MLERSRCSPNSSVSSAAWHTTRPRPRRRRRPSRCRRSASQPYSSAGTNGEAAGVPPGSRRGPRRGRSGPAWFPRWRGRSRKPNGCGPFPRRTCRGSAHKPTITVQPGALGKLDKFPPGPALPPPHLTRRLPAGASEHCTAARRGWPAAAHGPADPHDHPRPQHHKPGSRTPDDSARTPHAPEPPRNSRPAIARQPPPAPTPFGQHLEQTPGTPRSRPINQIGRDHVNSS